MPGVTPAAAGDAPTHRAAVRCDQAIFTSARTPTGDGYRIIAASPGLTREERTEVTKRSPSHGGLCGADERARAVSFYRLPGGRLCAAMSCLAGGEQSGRGGQRVYTRAVTFTGESLSAFAFNPFNVVRAMEARGLGAVELKPDDTLPVIELPANATIRDDETIKAIRRVGAGWLGYMLQATLTGQRLILVTQEGPGCLIEAVIMGLPRPLRVDVSFAWGLTFSIGRGFTLTGITGDTTATERIIRGQPLVLVRPRADAPPPRFEPGEWQHMVAEHWTEAAYHDLQEFTAQHFPDTSLATLERIAALRNETSRASVCDAAQLLSLADRRLEQPAAGPFEQHLLTDLLNTIRMRLEHIWSNATQPELTSAWPALVALVRKSPRALAHAMPLVALVLRRLASIAPDAALRLALDVGHDAGDAIENDLRKVVEAVQRWLPHADPAQRRAADRALKQWRVAFPGVADALVDARA